MYKIFCTGLNCMLMLPFREVKLNGQGLKYHLACIKFDDEFVTATGNLFLSLPPLQHFSLRVVINPCYSCNYRVLTIVPLSTIEY